MVISTLPAPAQAWLVDLLLHGCSVSWCDDCSRPVPADLQCSRCGSLTESIDLGAQPARRPS
jgi:predicted RNA-binding protein with PUA domain